MSAKPHHHKRQRCVAISLLLLMLAHGRARAGCGVNFDKMRKRRIEAIRGQILSKLGFTQLPPNRADPAPPVPREMESWYNQTRDFVLEQARLKRDECENAEDAYYAQDIATVPARSSRSPAAKRNQQPDALRGYKETRAQRGVADFFDFDLASYNFDPDAVVSATLRLYQVRNPAARGGIQQQVELYQLSSSLKADAFKPGKRFLHMRQLDTYTQGWQTFDVTSTVREWLENPKRNEGFELTIPCLDDDNLQSSSANRGVRRKLDVIFAGSSRIPTFSGRGDRDAEVTVPDLGQQFYPHLVVMTSTPSSRAADQGNASVQRNRRKRSLNADYCFRRNPSETNCCLRELYIDFRKDLNWHWIHAPSGYKANFCAGACPYLWSMDTQHAKILSLYRNMNPHASSAPCCTPKDHEPLTIMYYSNGRYKLTQMSDMLLVSCKCS